MTLLGNGSVGIGCTPVYPLEASINKPASMVVFASNADVNYGQLLGTTKTSLGDYNASYAISACGVALAGASRLSSITANAMLIDIAGDYPIIFGTNNVERARINSIGLGIGGGPGQAVDIYSPLGATSSAIGIRINTSMGATPYTMGYGLATDGSGNVYRFIGSNTHGFTGGVTPLKLNEQGGHVSIGGGVLGSFGLDGVQVVTMGADDNTTAPTSSNIEVRGSFKWTPTAGTLPDNTIVVVYNVDGSTPTVASYYQSELAIHNAGFSMIRKNGQWYRLTP
jgi:hypothetical protein